MAAIVFAEAQNLISPVPVSVPPPEPDGFPLKTIGIACATDLRFGASGKGTGAGRGQSIVPKSHPKHEDNESSCQVLSVKGKSEKKGPVSFFFPPFA